MRSSRAVWRVSGEWGSYGNGTLLHELCRNGGILCMKGAQIRQLRLATSA
jgi:hypothetical protein